MTTITATYSPDDNKLRLSASTRLPRDLYERVKAAGFAWAPKQKQFIAPMWTPERADLCIELAGDIDDDDGSLIERAEERSERFEGYQERRAADAITAQSYVASIADNIPLGQPILVGHHSEKRARKDAERIENGMRRAVRAFETSEYWERRAAAAIRHAKYKERADVRARRIKGLEADERKQVRHIETAQACARIWQKVPRCEWDAQTEVARMIAGRTTGPVPYEVYSRLSDGKMHGDTAWRVALAACERSVAYHERWLAHYRNRLAYERAMLADAGGTAAQQVEAGGQAFEVGGRVKVRGEWFTVRKVNRRAGVLTSITTDRRFVATIGPEEVQAYEAPAPEVAEAAKAAAKVPPILNYRGDGFHVLTRAEWAAIHADYKGTRELGVGAAMRYGREPDALLQSSQAAGQVRHRVRSAMVRGVLAPVFISDEKEKQPPKVGEEKPARRSWKPKAQEPADTPPAVDPPATYFQDEPLAGAAHAAALGADPAQVAAIVDTCMRRRREWAEEGREPLAHDIQREADGLLAAAEQRDFAADLAPAYRAASLHLLDLADAARAREREPLERRRAAYKLGQDARSQPYALNPFAYTPGDGEERDAWFNGHNGHADGSKTDAPATHSQPAAAAAPADAPPATHSQDRHYAIRSISDPAAFWNNTAGWVGDGCSVDVFTQADRERLRLPLDGEWFELRPPATHSQGDDGAREHCPHCDCEHVPGAMYCQACGRSMDGAETYTPAPPATHFHNSDARFCAPTAPAGSRSIRTRSRARHVRVGDTLTLSAEGAASLEPPKPRAEIDREAFLAMREQLRNGGVQVVSAPQLFPTPPDLARRMLEAAGIFDGARVLEPSAGTGRLIDAWLDCDRTGSLVAVEVSRELADGLHRRYSGRDHLTSGGHYTPGRHVETITADFLARDLAIGTFDAVVMNPPFAGGVDVDHVRRAFGYLADGGRLVAIMSAGVTFRSDRKTREFREWVARLGGEFEELPPGTFESSGTSVRTVLLVLQRPENGPESRGAEERAKVRELRSG